ncbi:uncharacterized protein LOC124451455 isoform X2 [Xenia sp. Carnegie-2017]|nr:uncharacterized protein LOC124451455 isoform X2 [Xenia sp. Carnegie-2017]XP_046858025.1 uncharacterized protein LOC124451455 isoform X2 [Xenia sp. Carnegie-2017]XP_046858026.1 uncharacterized protein LOC124451455 isoform X2 [Xenia sp. Carnegie-2017]XP_046858027.1 uncharacterized protein LOC124451455 isoform X2 [Xenia sp. Carnegie-2017]XP_046858028.1 uncharacterized protein LOC124451455 isoform X2 [Xenia sp. Carnegie-2017]XP_046858029.1 uncharacterized protein LOC124451455 isoform X2 [Xenia 
MSVLSSDKKTNGFKLMRLIVDVGGKALRTTLRKQLSGIDLYDALNDPENAQLLSNLKNRQIHQHQWDQLYPGPLISPNENKFDITLLCILLRNICGLKPPRDPIWTSVNDPTDYSTEADITRIRLFRNERFAHLPSTSVSCDDFENLWLEISEPLGRLGIRQEEIDRLKNEFFGNEERERILREWDRLKSDLTDIKNDQRGIKRTVEGVEKDLQQVKDFVTVMKDEVDEIRHHPHLGPEEDILTKNLVSCNIESEIEHHYEKYLLGTREWVFKEFLDWFKDDTSQNRAFVISAVAGMGKSVIAATLCKRYPQYLTAVHFFQHNNSRYNKANVLLQSLAMQVSRKFPAYKQLLVKKLSGKLSQPLNNMNVEGLFSLLFTELFCNISEAPHRMLVVLDALDECGYPERDDLANLIANHLHKLPHCFRFVITTRPNEVALNKFEKLNPLFINCSDDRNLEDIKFLISDSLSNLKDILVEKADGLMLLASLLSSEVKNLDLLKGSISKDLSEYYEICLIRLSEELFYSFDISNKKFQSILNALAVAKEPLPWEMIDDVLCLNSSRESLGVRKIISCLFVTNEEECVSFFHKSLKDWLLDDRKHDYSVKTFCGHRLVLQFCLKTLDNLKAEGVNYDVIKHVTVRYSVKYWLHHALKISDNNDLVKNVCKYLIDLKILFASVWIDADLTLENYFLINEHDVYFHLPKETRPLFNDIYVVLTWQCSCDDKEEFLQNVLDNVNGLASQASNLLKKRFKDLPYIENFETGFVKARLFRLERKLESLDVSRKHDYVVCGYRTNVVQLFSLRTNKCLWIKNMRSQLKEAENIRCCVVFHPFENLIFASQLDNVMNIKGKICPSPFHCDDSTSKFFTNKCFSKDKDTMVTSYKDILTVWDVEKGEKKQAFTLHNNVTSLCFSKSESILGLTEEKEEEEGEEKRVVFRIYDLSKGYETFVFSHNMPAGLYIMSSIGDNSWCCKSGKELFIVNPNGEKLTNFSGKSVYDYLYPLDPFDNIIPNYFFPHKYEKHFFCLLNDDNVLVFGKKFYRYVFLVTRTHLTTDVKYGSEICTNGNFLYQFNDFEERSQGKSNLIIKNLNTGDTFVRKCLLKDMLAVKNAVILHREYDIPELWSNDLTNLLYSFDELKKTMKILSVSDVLIACQTADSVVFFNIENKREEFALNFETHVSVLACSVKFHVFAQVYVENKKTYSLWCGENLVDGWEDIFQHQIRSVDYAEFSPLADKLMVLRYYHFLHVYDVKDKQIIYIVTGDKVDGNIAFLDSRYIIHEGTDTLWLIDTRNERECCRHDFSFVSVYTHFCRKSKHVYFFFRDNNVLADGLKINLPRK